MTRIGDFPNLIFKHYDVLGTVIAGNNGDTGCFENIRSYEVAFDSFKDGLWAQLTGVLIFSHMS